MQNVNALQLSRSKQIQYEDYLFDLHLTHLLHFFRLAKQINVNYFYQFTPCTWFDLINTIQVGKATKKAFLHGIYC